MQSKQLGGNLTTALETTEETAASEQRTFLVVDDHEIVLQSLAANLKLAYPQATVIVAQDSRTARQHVKQHSPDLIVVDLELPEVLGETAQAKNGISLLKMLMEREPAASLLVLGSSISPLVRLREEIYRYPEGFAAADKTSSTQQILKLADLALRRSTYLPAYLRSPTTIRPQWATLLQLKFQGALSDAAISKRMGISTRTIRSYWLHIQDALNLHPDADKDLRVQIEQAARQAGLID